MITGNSTLSEVWEHIRTHADTGLDCPACGQRIKVYWRSPNWEMAVVAIRLYRYHLEHPWEYSHVRDFTMSHPSAFKNYNWLGDYSKLRWWRLAEPAPPAEDGSVRSGLWRITQSGIEWVTEQVKVPHYVRVFDANAIGEPDHFTQGGEWRPPVGIKDALDNKFDFGALMRGEA